MVSTTPYPLAPELDTSAWINTPEPLSLASLRGKVVVIHAFQMLCPGCVSHGIPQASAIHQLYPIQDLQVIGLHSVFEHHEVMTLAALQAFAAEYRLRFPIAVDKPSATGPIPMTMKKYQLQGTPTLMVLDKQGHLRLSHFGQISDMQLGSIIGGLLAEHGLASDVNSLTHSSADAAAGDCDDKGCPTE